MAETCPEFSESEEVWLQALRRKDRRALARLLTFAESTLEEQQLKVAKVLSLAGSTTSVRIALSGAPGVGKSTLIDALGTLITEEGRSLAVSTVDPSSVISGGSILADKTRMHRLATNPNTFVRPSASGGTHGGVGPHTATCLALLETAGFEVIILETVGVGQSEVDAAALVDCFVLVVPPMEGDEIQGMKRGITEHVDLIVVNKADQDPNLAARTAEQYSGASHLLRGRGTKVLTTSARRGEGIDHLWSHVKQVVSDRRDESSGRFRSAAKEQLEKRVLSQVEAEFRRRLHAQAHADGPIGNVLQHVVEGDLSTNGGVREMLQLLLRDEFAN
jgi:LAO/AO transport system kinase